MIETAQLIGVYDRFWDMTLYEFSGEVRAHGKRKREEYEKEAWHIAHVINCWSKKKVRPSQLLKGGKDSRIPREHGEHDKKAMKEHLRKIKAKEAAG